MCHLSTSLYYHLGTIHPMLISWAFSLISFNKAERFVPGMVWSIGPFKCECPAEHKTTAADHKE